MRAIIPLALAAMIATLAPASAQAEQEMQKEPCPDGYVESPEGCSRQAWVDDCPPDMMCAAGADGSAGNTTGADPDGPTYGPCDGEVCASGNGTDHGCGPEDTYCYEPMPYGPGDCIQCSGPAPGNATDGNGTSGSPGTCMDGQQVGEDCRDDVVYFGPGPDDTGAEPGRGPADCENCRGDEEPAPESAGPDGAKKDAPALGLALLAMSLVALVVAARRV